MLPAAAAALVGSIAKILAPAGSKDIKVKNRDTLLAHHA
jgi:hypothetical protein